MRWTRLYKTIKAKLGWFFTACGIIRWILDLWGRGEVIRDIAAYFPSAARLLQEVWVTPTIIIVGVGLIVWSALERGATIGLDGARWLPEHYRRRRVPHEYVVGSGIVLALAIFGLTMHHIQQPGSMEFYKAWFNDEQSYLSATSPLNVHLWMRNLGGFPVNNVYTYYEARLVKIGSDNGRTVHTELRTNALNHLTDVVNAGSRGVTVGRQHGLWDTLRMELSQAQVEGIENGQMRIYIYAWARWKDAQHDLDFCEWLQQPQSGDVSSKSLIWHVCDQT
jgi:hypothetical protein